MTPDFSARKALWSVVKYELIWDIRKWKFYILLAIVTAGSLLAAIFLGKFLPVPSKSMFWYSSLSYMSEWFFFLLLGAALAMNTISGEFETGTIVPLLSRPISRSEIYFGKVIAIVLMTIFEMAVLAVILTVTSYVMMGPQSDLYRLALFVLTLSASVMVYAFLTMALSALTKNSVASILGIFGIALVLEIGLGIYELAHGLQAWFLWIPLVGTGTLTPNVEAALSSPNSPFYLLGITHTPTSLTNLQGAMISLAGTIIYIAAFIVIGWLSFKKSDVKE